MRAFGTIIAAEVSYKTITTMNRRISATVGCFAMTCFCFSIASFNYVASSTSIAHYSNSDSDSNKSFVIDVISFRSRSACNFSSSSKCNYFTNAQCFVWELLLT